VNDRPPTSRRAATPRQPAFAARFALVLLVALTSLALSCRRRSASTSSGTVDPSDPEAQRAQQREVFKQAMISFFNYQEYDSAEVLQQAVDRLDQWARDQEPPPDWKLDPMVATLPEPLSEVPKMLRLDQLDFPNSDAFTLREAVWIRDVSNWARGEAVDELDRAQALFDWTVRNIQLDWDPGPATPDRPPRVLQKPWETLLIGRGTATDRAWLFILLARQQRIDAALVALIDPDDPAVERPRPWVVAVLSQGALYLFEPTLGLPIPAPGPIERGPAGQLEIRPATLAQVAADGSLLNRLDVDAKLRYPVDSSQVEKVAVLLEASPAYLSQRMKLVESNLAGDERLVLTTDPSGQAEQFRACRHVADVRLWAMPYQTIVQERQLGAVRSRWWQLQMIPFLVAHTGSFPSLWKGRQYHLKGIFTGDQTASSFYQTARPPDSFINSPDLDPRIKAALARAKMHASYWLGLLAARAGQTDAAIDWLATRTLKATPDGPWTPGAKYNLGRLYEAQGEIAKAVEAYKSDTDSPARHGNLLRARWLQPPEEKKEETPENAQEPAAEATANPPKDTPESPPPAPAEE